MMASKVLTNHSVYQTSKGYTCTALSAMYHIHIPVRSFEVWLHHDIYVYMGYTPIWRDSCYIDP